ncbi:MAG TPA: hypothetical protein VH063_03635 [Gaiellaceae bacterium]|jgi:hypothetical protein|nr:hypothetical protein [Gaiellaceae bacterium]
MANSGKGAKKAEKTAPQREESRNIAICYNRACSDYRRERPLGEPCACKKKSTREPMFMRDYEFKE